MPKIAAHSRLRPFSRTPHCAVCIARGIHANLQHDACAGIQNEFRQAGIDDVICRSVNDWELERFVEAGLAPLEVLRIASLDAATALGRDDLGSLEAGKMADLVLLDHDALADIHNTRSIWRVVRAGWVFDPEELLGGVAR